MTLSQAIRAGCLKSAPGKGNQGMLGPERCVLGAALLGADLPQRGPSSSGHQAFNAYERLKGRFPILRSLVTWDGIQDVLISALWYRNDHEDITREQLADWVEQLERKWDGKVPEEVV